MAFLFKAMNTNQDGGGGAYYDVPPPAVRSWATSDTGRRRKPGKRFIANNTKTTAVKKPAAKPKGKAKAKIKEPSPSPSESSDSSSTSWEGPSVHVSSPSPSPSPLPRSTPTSPSPIPRKPSKPVIKKPAPIRKKPVTAKVTKPRITIPKVTAPRTTKPKPSKVKSEFIASDNSSSISESQAAEEEEQDDLTLIATGLAEYAEVFSLLDASDTFRKLGPIIRTALKEWTDYLKDTSSLSSYATLTNTDITPETKKEALLHVIEALPARHANLVGVYGDDSLELVELPKVVEELREGLKVGMENEEGVRGELKLTGFYNNMLFKGVKFREAAFMADKMVKQIEDARLKELKELMGLYEKLEVLEGEGKLDKDVVEALVEAMEDAGLSAGPAESKAGWVFEAEIKGEDVKGEDADGEDVKRENAKMVGITGEDAKEKDVKE